MPEPTIEDLVRDERWQRDWCFFPPFAGAYSHWTVSMRNGWGETETVATAPSSPPRPRHWRDVMSDLTEQQLAELERLSKFAPPGKWERFGYIGHAGGLCGVCAAGDGPRLECKEPTKKNIAQCGRSEDAALIVAMRNAIDQLVADSRAYRKLLKNQSELYDSY